VLAAFEVVGVNSNEDLKNKTQTLDNKEKKHISGETSERHCE